MAGEKIREIFCWKLKSGRLNIYLASSTQGAAATSLSLTDDRDCSEYFREIFPLYKITKNEKINGPLIGAIKDSLAGKPLSTELPLDINCTPFQRMVLNKIAQIPFGQTRTYGDVARMAGRPKGARAIGQVMNKNPLPLLFPCHRVVAADGIGGFRSGIELKKYLLKMERKR